MFDAHTERQSDHVDDLHVVRVASRRQTPLFIICDESMNVLFASAGAAALGLSGTQLESLASRCRSSIALDCELQDALDADTALRIVPLGSALGSRVAIFFEVLTRRDPVTLAVRRYGLTKRETDVLKLLMQNQSSGQMARSLCVAECTISDHVRSIMRKFDVTKRAAIYRKVFAGDDGRRDARDLAV